MEAVKMFFFLTGLLLTFTKCAECRKPVNSVADLDNEAIQTVFSQSVGEVSTHCLWCICKAETGCIESGCKWYNGTQYCGAYLINEKYWIQCGRIGNDFMSCANDLRCSTNCVRNYVNLFGQFGLLAGCTDSCQTYARTHVGGSYGCRIETTIPFWNKVKSFGCQ